jgi:anti-sigma factor RsiW
MGWRCVLYQNHLALYVGDDLSESETRAVETHLQSCPACRRRVDALGESRRLLTDCPSDPADSELGHSIWPALARRLHERNVRQRPRASWLPMGAMVAASVAIGVVVWNRPVNLPPLPGAVSGPGGASTSNDWNAPDWAAGLTLPTRSDRATPRSLRNDAMMDEPQFHLETAVPLRLSDGDF